MQEAPRESSAALAAKKVESLHTAEPQAHHGPRRGGVPPVAVIRGGYEREILAPARFAGTDEAEPLLARVAKRALDIASVFVLTAVFSPFLVPLLVAMAFSKGPIIYAHRRIGRDGKLFQCYKFRTMVPDADKVLHDLLECSPELKAEWLRDRKLRYDPRVTRIGNFLRRTSLDELPQLWNVLRGDMSMVGPRPIVKEELLRYGRSAPLYLSLRPGVTGLWQVSGRNNTDYRRRVAIDVYYVRNRSLFLDFYILLKTVRVVVGRHGAY